MSHNFVELLTSLSSHFELDDFCFRVLDAFLCMLWTTLLFFQF